MAAVFVVLTSTDSRKQARSNTRIEIVRSVTKGFSSLGRESAKAIQTTLSKHYPEPKITIINNLADLEELVRRKPDLVFMGMECIPVQQNTALQNSGVLWISQYLDAHNIAYTGSEWRAHRLGRNKVLAKEQMLDSGLKTSPFYVLKQDEADVVDADTILGYPLFVKPADRGGGQGIDSKSVVRNNQQLRDKVSSITASYNSDSLVEKYLSGREFSVAILRRENSIEFDTMPLELITPADKFGLRVLGSRVKSANTEQAVSITDAVIKQQVATLAIDAFNALGGRDYGRIDIRMDSANTPHFLEANLIPSLITGYGSFPKACVLNIGLEYEPMILRIVNLGLGRHVETAIMQS